LNCIALIYCARNCARSDQTAPNSWRLRVFDFILQIQYFYCIFAHIARTHFVCGIAAKSPGRKAVLIGVEALAYPTRRVAMNMLIRIPSLAVAVYFISVAPAHAYIDPGTGSMVLQIVLAAAVGALFFFKIIWRKLKSFFTSSRKNRE
jgi:hypothetical protein